MRYPMPPMPTQAERDAVKAAIRRELRDEFAKAALTGLIANSRNHFRDVEEVAFRAYQIAEAMLQRRDLE